MPAQDRSAKNHWVPIFVAVLIIGSIVIWLLARSNNGPWVVPAAAKTLANPVPSDLKNLAAAKLLYSDNCARCHGDHGDGDGPDASMYKTPPGVLSDAGKMNQQTDGEIFWKISEGRRPMPSYKKDLSDQQRWQLVDFIRTLATNQPKGAPAQSSTSTTN